MSTIKLSPNASGTGALTIAAPNTNTNYTLTLPTETGTVLTGAGPYTASSSATAGAVTIDASNNVGIGTSSPTVRLQVTSGTTGTLAVQSTGTSGQYPSSGSGMEFVAGSASAQDSIISYNRTSSAWRDLYLQANNLLMETAGSERARINSSGQLLVGTTSATSLGSFTGSTNVCTYNFSGITLTQYGVVAGFYYDRLNFNNSQYFVVNSSNVGVYLGSGSTAWSAYSDLRLKNVTGTYTNALADIAKLEPIKFTWKSDESAKPCVGLSAQSVQQVVPEAVDSVRLPDSGDDTEYLSVRYQEVIPLLTAAIQELKAEVDALKAQLGAKA